MDGDKRRENMMKILQQAHKPINGTQLSKELGVSRQVIVQDVALLRVANKNIVSTNRGYILYDPIKAIQRPK
ncbi:MAG TPA: HTH domain-containing protein, partial [Candidatus Merdenecus merdavium]|nr:HTH domain-containing protein [Candidatus Merdenecus merdavium]